MSRPRILLAWELGGGLGHLAPLRVLAGHLRERGWDCVWAVRNLDTAARFLVGEGVAAIQQLHQAPLAQQPPQHPLEVQLNYASTLFSCGYDDPLTLAVRLKAWCALLRQTGCVRVIANHAPSALLAARALGLPAAWCGTGFTVPPAVRPFPAYVAQANMAVMQDNEQKISGLVNQALKALGAPELPQLQDLFTGSPPGLFTYAETDHFAEHRPAGHLGLHDLSGGTDLDWGPERRPRVFAMVNPSPGTAALLKALQSLNTQVLIKTRDLPLPQLVSLQRPGLVITQQAVRLRQAMESCDVFVGHGAHGATVEALLAGKPQLLLPDQRERQLLAARLVAMGAAVSLPNAEAADYTAALTELIENLPARAAAASFAALYSRQDRTRILQDWCDSVLV